MCACGTKVRPKFKESSTHVILAKGKLIIYGQIGKRAGIIPKLFNLHFYDDNNFMLDLSTLIINFLSGIPISSFMPHTVNSCPKRHATIELRFGVEDIWIFIFSFQFDLFPHTLEVYYGIGLISLRLHISTLRLRSRPSASSSSSSSSSSCSRCCCLRLFVCLFVSSLSLPSSQSKEGK